MAPVCHSYQAEKPELEKLGRGVIELFFCLKHPCWDYWFVTVKKMQGYIMNAVTLEDDMVIDHYDQ